MYISESSIESSNDSIWTTEKDAKSEKCRQRRRQSCGTAQQQARRLGNILMEDKKKTPRKLTRSCSSSGYFGGSSGWTDATSDIFYIYDHQRTYTKPDIGLEHHSNLEVGSLTVRQQLYLALIYYFTWRNILRGVVVLAVFAWFMFNVVMIFMDFLNSESVVYMEYQMPNWTMPPSVSVCIICRSCFNKTQPITTELLFSNDKSIEGPNITLPDSKDIDTKTGFYYLPGLSDLVKSCTLVSNGLVSVVEQQNNQLDCYFALHVPVTVHERSKCYTFFSDIYGDLSAKSDSKKNTFRMDFKRSPYIQLRFHSAWLRNEIYQAQSKDHELALSEQNSEGVFVAIHDHNVPPNMLEQTYQRVMQNRQFDIKFSKKIEEWNPEDSIDRLWSSRKCYVYNKQAKVSNELPFSVHILQNGTIIPSKEIFELKDLSNFRSRGECFLQCLWAKNFEGQNSRLKCFNYYLLFSKTAMDEFHQKFDKSHRMKMCSESEEQLKAYNKMKNICEKFCQKDCTEHTFYTENVLEVTDFAQSEAYEAVINIEWNTGLNIYIRHKDRMHLYNFLGSLGGHAHVWLGVSVVSLLSFFAKMFRSGSDMLRTENAHGCCHFTFLWCRACKHRNCDIEK